MAQDKASEAGSSELLRDPSPEDEGKQSISVAYLVRKDASWNLFCQVNVARILAP